MNSEWKNEFNHFMLKLMQLTQLYWFAKNKKLNETELYL